MGPLFHAFGVFAVLVLASAVSVYGFGYYERVLSAGASFSVLVLTAGLAAFAAAVSFGITSASLGRFAGSILSFVLGLVVGLVAAVANWLLPGGVGLASFFAMIFLASAAACFTVPRAGV